MLAFLARIIQVVWRVPHSYPIVIFGFTYGQFPSNYTRQI
jgi:hypothetical protein